MERERKQSRHHPYANPLSEISFRWGRAHTAYEIRTDEKEVRTIIPPAPSHQPISWSERGIRPSDFAWVDLGTSLQWSSFKLTVETLQSRNNSVSVLVGPFNEHLLTDAGKARYTEMKRHVVSWLEERKIPHLAPEPLPSELYADASHPLADGYALLAKQLFQNQKSVRREAPATK